MLDQQTSRARGHTIPAWSLALIVLAAYTAVAVVHLRRSAWDVSAFIVAGDVFADRSRLEAPIAIQPNSPGYDGQFYYRLGLDPFTAERTAHGITIDTPATRAARILYPLLAWAASLGSPAALPWAMLGLNLAGLFALAWMGVAIARTHGALAWTGLLPAFYPGYIVTLIRDTTEVAASVPTLAAVLFALRNRPWPAAAFASVAILARETTLFALAGFGLVELATCIRARRLSGALAAYATPAAVFVAWQAAVLWHWNLATISDIAGNDLGPPLAGVAGFFVTSIDALYRGAGAPPPNVRIYWVLDAAMCVASFALFFIVASRRRAPAALTLSWVFYAALVLCFTAAIWVEPYAFLRACTDGFLLGALMVCLSRDRLAAWALAALVIPVWLLCAAKL